ncbi:MAG: HEAT repeat domain-containing protein, partial [Aridibacter sp.]
MKQFITIFITLFFFSSIQTLAQVADYKNAPMEQLLQIVKAEDELRYDKILEDLMKDKNPSVRKRAALAAGRIGDEKAIPFLATVLEKDSDDIRQTAAFALGEIESIKGADAILRILSDYEIGHSIRSSAIEAAGKIAAANEKDEKSKMLREMILSNLEFEANKRSAPSEDVILMGITAVLRAKTEGAETTVAKFLTYSNWRIRADALNTLARLRAKNVNEKATELISKDENPIVRANAARVLGTANYEAALDLILDKALNDKDLRVRINAIRALSSFKNEKIHEKLLERAENLFAIYKKSKYKNPIEENELLTIASTLGTLLKGTNNERAVKFLDEFRKLEKYKSSEVEIALVSISPKTYAETNLPKDIDWWGTSSFVAGLSEAADLEDNGEDVQNLRKIAKVVLDI